MVTIQCAFSDFQIIIFVSSDRDPAEIERSNLVSLMKLVVKDLIESSMKYGRVVDSHNLPLNHFFILLEHVMRHGLKG